MSNINFPNEIIGVNTPDAKGGGTTENVENKNRELAKKQALDEMYLSLEYLFNGIYLLKFNNYAIIVSQKCGGVYRVNLDRFSINCIDHKIILQRKKKPWDMRIVYENAVFYPTLRTFLMESGQRCSGGYKCFTIYKCYDGKYNLIFRDHQLQVLVKYGLELLRGAIGNTGRELCINHINGNKQDNNSVNLEVITNKENAQHFYQQLYEAMIRMVKNNEYICI